MALHQLQAGAEGLQSSDDRYLTAKEHLEEQTGQSQEKEKKAMSQTSWYHILEINSPMTFSCNC